MITDLVESVAAEDTAYFDGGTAQIAVSKITQLAKNDKPFFLAGEFKKPHRPLAAPKKDWDLYNRKDVKVHPCQKKPQNAPKIAYQDSW